MELNFCLWALEHRQLPGESLQILHTIVQHLSHGTHCCRRRTKEGKKKYSSTPELHANYMFTNTHRHAAPLFIAIENRWGVCGGNVGGGGLEGVWGGGIQSTCLNINKQHKHIHIHKQTHKCIWGNTKRNGCLGKNLFVYQVDGWKETYWQGHWARTAANVRVVVDQPWWDLWWKVFFSLLPV